MRKKSKKGNRSAGSKIWSVLELLAYDTERVLMPSVSASMGCLGSTEEPSGRQLAPQSLVRKVRRGVPGHFLFFRLFLFPDPEARVAPVYYAYRVIQCTYGWSPSLAAAACFALVSIPLLWRFIPRGTRVGCCCLVACI